MESKLKILGHPVHPMLIVFPIGLFVTALAFDIIYLITGNGFWGEAAYYLIVGGLVGGALAMVTGWIDWFGIPAGTRAKRIGTIHGVGNVVVLVLFVVTWFWRTLVTGIDSPDVFAIALSAVAVALAGVTAWLGGELVDRLGVGVDPGAHVDSPSSLSDKPASAIEPSAVAAETEQERRRAA